MDGLLGENPLVPLATLTAALIALFGLLWSKRVEVRLKHAERKAEVAAELARNLFEVKDLEKRLDAAGTAETAVQARSGDSTVAASADEQVKASMRAQLDRIRERRGEHSFAAYLHLSRVTTEVYTRAFEDSTLLPAFIRVAREEIWATRRGWWAMRRFRRKHRAWVDQKSQRRHEGRRTSP